MAEEVLPRKPYKTMQTLRILSLLQVFMLMSVSASQDKISCTINVDRIEVVYGQKHKVSDSITIDLPKEEICDVFDEMKKGNWLPLNTLIRQHYAGLIIVRPEDEVMVNKGRNLDWLDVKKNPMLRKDCMKNLHRVSIKASEGVPSDFVPYELKDLSPKNRQKMEKGKVWKETFCAFLEDANKENFVESFNTFMAENIDKKWSITDTKNVDMNVESKRKKVHRWIFKTKKLMISECEKIIRNLVIRAKKEEEEDKPKHKKQSYSEVPADKIEFILHAHKGIEVYSKMESLLPKEEICPFFIENLGNENWLQEFNTLLHKLHPVMNKRNMIVEKQDDIFVVVQQAKGPLRQTVNEWTAREDCNTQLLELEITAYYEESRAKRLSPTKSTWDHLIEWKEIIFVLLFAIVLCIIVYRYKANASGLSSHDKKTL